MPVDRKYPDILHCAVCKRPWKKQARGTLPKRCPYLKCRSRRWLDGVDHREGGNELFMSAVREGMLRTAEIVRQASQ